jgi:hypothetical protein
MKVKLLVDHKGEGRFPTFKRDTVVTLKKECTHYPHWYACEIEGHDTYVPECYVREGALVRDYDPTELVQKAGDILEVREIVYAWLIATNQNGVTGWIPAESVVSE